MPRPQAVKIVLLVTAVFGTPLTMMPEPLRFWRT